VSLMLDEGEDPTDSSTGVEEITHFKVFTIDDLTQSDPKRFEDQLPSGYDSQDVKVREHGLVVATDPTDEYYDKPLG
ncbi:hypothetical protein N3930_47550, partial [Bacillus thuringiensis]|nr:hypothetical protein [Bacillus thuringiensis]